MTPLREHERLEMETLDALRKNRSLEGLMFGGGTVLRLCHELPRYSVDLDFFLKNPSRGYGESFDKTVKMLEGMGFEITDQAEKHFSWLMEIRKTSSPRRLKIEIRKDESRALDREIGIAFSSSAPNLQVRLTVCSLKQMWKNKVDALIDRRAIRDAYDLEFLIRRGAGDFSALKKAEIKKIADIIEAFTPRDFSSTLGALLPPEERNRLKSGKFSLLEGAVRQCLAD